MGEAHRQFANRSRRKWSSSIPSPPPRAVVSVSLIRSARRAGGLGNCGTCIAPRSCSGHMVFGWWPATTARGSADQPDLSASASPSIPSRPQSASGRATSSGGFLRCGGARNRDSHRCGRSCCSERAEMFVRVGQRTPIRQAAPGCATSKNPGSCRPKGKALEAPRGRTPSISTQPEGGPKHACPRAATEVRRAAR